MNTFKQILSKFLTRNQQKTTIMLTAYIRYDGQFDINIDDQQFVIANFNDVRSIDSDWYVDIQDFPRNTVITLANKKIQIA